MAQEVRGVVARSKGAPVTRRDDRRARSRSRRGARARCRRAACATPTCTTARAPSTTTSRSCSATRRRASSRRSATASPSVAPGDFVILNWRAVCGECRACRRGRPWYCFATHNATQKMTLADGTELSPALGIGAFAEKTLVAAGQATKVEPGRDAGDRRTARLRRDGRARRGDAHRQRAARRHRRGVRLRRRRRRRDRGRAPRRAPARSSRSTSTTASSSGRRSSARPTPSNAGDERPGRGGPRAHRRLRRRRVHRGGRPARGDAAGVLRPRPRRHARAGRRARPVDDDRAADDRVLRSGRRAEAELVRRLPPVAATSRC